MAPPVSEPSEGLNAAVAAQLRAERAAQNVTVKQLADLSGVSFSSLRRYLAADRQIDVSVLAALAEALNTTALDVVKGRRAAASQSTLGRRPARDGCARPSRRHCAGQVNDHRDPAARPST